MNDHDGEDDIHDWNMASQEATAAGERSKKSKLAEEVDGQQNFAAGIENTYRLRSRQGSHQPKEKSNTEVSRIKKQRHSPLRVAKKKGGRKCKRSRKSPGSLCTTANAVELYIIHNNGKKTYSVQRVKRDVPRWEDLDVRTSVVVAQETYSIDDVVYVLLQDGLNNSIARIRQIRELG